MFFSGLLAAVLAVPGGAQEVNTLYFMKLPQANLMNPASQQYCNFYLNLPVAGATNVSVMSSWDPAAL